MHEVEVRPSPGEVRRGGPESLGAVSRRWGARVAAGIAILACGATVGWAVTTVLTPPKDVLGSVAYTYVEVVEGEVGASLTLNTVAEWTPEPAGNNLAQGVVTSINVTPGQEVSAGAILYSVNLRPVVIAQGSTPSFRSLARGANGVDVSQLQSFLSSLGFYSGAADGVFGPATAQAVRGWQRTIGVAADGVVQASDLVFVPSLPTRVSLDGEAIERGASLSGGEEVVRALPAAPDFTIPVTDTQAVQMPLGTRVEIQGPSGERWEATVAGQITIDDDAAVTVQLEGVDGASICSDACASIPVSEASLLRSRVVTVETARGLVVPAAALRSDVAGTISLVDDLGEVHEVKVVTTARGMALITGVPEGTMVRIPGE